MGRVTVLLSGLPSYVTLVELSFYLEYLFKPNSEIGTFELRHLPRAENKQLVALDFRSGFDAIAAQEQLDGYRYEMPDGAQYILCAKITNNKEYLRSDSSPESSRKRSRSPSTKNEAWLAMAMLPGMSDAAMLRANAKLDAKYRLLQKQKLILQSEMELIRERRKLRREYAQADNSDSDDETTSSGKPRSSSREHSLWSQELELFKIKLAAKIQALKRIDSQRSAPKCKRRSPSCDTEDQSASLERVKPKPSSRERSLNKHVSGSRVRSRVHRSRSLTRSPPCKSKSRERSWKYRSKSRVRSRAVRSKSLSRSPRNSKSRSRTSSPRTRRPRSRARRCCYRRSCSLDTKSRDKKIERSRNRSSYKRLRSPDGCSRSKRLRSPDSGSRSKRLRSPDSGSRSRRSRSRGRLLAIMPKSPVKETSLARSKFTQRSAVNNSDFEITTKENRNKPENSPEHSENNKSYNLSGYTDIGSKKVVKNLVSDVKTKSNLPEKNCTITSVATKSNAIEKKLKVEDIKNIASNNRIQNSDNFFSKDTHNKTDSTEREDAKNKKQTKTKNDTVARKVKIKEIMIRSICTDIMYMMEALLFEIAVNENITISENNSRIMKEKLNMIVQKRVLILYEEEQITILNACENYRKICTKQDDTLLLKQMLDDLKSQEADSTTGQNNPSALEKPAHDSPENAILKASDDQLTTVTNDSKEDKDTNNDQITEQEILKTNINEKKTAEVTEIIDIETYCPKQFSDKGVAKDKPIPTCPQFVLVIKKLMKQLKPVLLRSRQQRVYVNYFDMKQVLRIILTDILKGEGYKTSSQILALFRQKYPRDDDDELVRKVADDINMKKHHLEGMDRERQDDDNDDDVILMENKHEVIVISDDETDDIRKKILYIINSLNGLTENEKINEFNYNDLSEIEKIEVAFNVTEPEEINKIKETDITAPNDSETTDVAFKNIIQTKESEEINAVDNNSIIEQAEICNTIVKQEEQQHSEIVQNQVKTADFMVSKEVHVTETECDRTKEEKSNESLKVTAITIMTSETELHSIANAIENGTVEDPKESIKEEIETELTDAELDKILSLENFSLDMLTASDAGEKETPQVISVTITTSASELFSLKHDGVENTSKGVSEVKIESNEDICSEIQALVQDDDHMEDATLGGVNGGVSNTTNAEMLCPEPQDKRLKEDEEETIESISKYLTSFCNDLY